MNLVSGFLTHDLRFWKKLLHHNDNIIIVQDDGFLHSALVFDLVDLSIIMSTVKSAKSIITISLLSVEC